jgi:protein-L-isoaspartate(D-aspartate) O-methyltransferase
MSQEVLTEQRRAMVETQLVARGIRDPAVLEAMRSVPREAFVLPELVERAYDDIPLPIGEGQTISQPYIVAVMAEALQLSPDERVLEIGTGSGYAAAVLSCMVKQVYTVERLEKLATLARHRLQELGYPNVQVLHGNGMLGWPAYAPYDGIVVTASGPRVPEALQAQLGIGGRLVMPIGAHRRWQKLVRVTRTRDTTFRHEDLGAVCFVPLIGAQGWTGDQANALGRLADDPGATLEAAENP